MDCGRPSLCLPISTKPVGDVVEHITITSSKGCSDQENDQTRELTHNDDKPHQIQPRDNSQTTPSRCRHRLCQAKRLATTQLNFRVVVDVHIRLNRTSSGGSQGQ